VCDLKVPPWRNLISEGRQSPSIGHPRVEVVFPNSPAAHADLRPGDRLTSADGMPLSSQWTSMYFEANIALGRTV
jgi:S1-C subfamily serine protease